MEVLHWTVDVVEPDQGWNARWRNETDMSHWSLTSNIESEEGEDNARAAYIDLYVRVESETLEEVAGKLQKWFRPHFGPGWSFQHLTYIYEPDLERAFDEGEKLKQMEFFAEMKKWSDNLAREEVNHGKDGEAVSSVTFTVPFTVPIKCPECGAMQEGSEFLGVASSIQTTCQACDHVALLGEFRKETPGYRESKRKGDGETGGGGG